MSEEESLYREALAWYDRDQYAPAAEALERLLARLPAQGGGPPSRADVLYKLANARGEMGDWAAAAKHLESVLDHDPLRAEAMNNLGAAHQHLGRPMDAEGCYRRAIASRPSLPAPYMNLGRLLQSQGREVEAAALYQAALDGGLDRGLFGHLLEATRGTGAAKAPQSYVRETFDAFASQFDRHLTDALGYRVPERLCDMVRKTNGQPHPDVLDLGCGTGLVGQALRGAGKLVGVDASPRMLEAASRRGLYTELHEADIEAWLGGTRQEAFDLAVAADVFIYVGRLDGIFPAVAGVLRPGGRFAFSIETCDEGDWRLRPSGRYAQSDRYIARLAERYGFAIELHEAEVIRKGVPGALYVLSKKT